MQPARWPDLGLGVTVTGSVAAPQVERPDRCSIVVVHGDCGAGGVQSSARSPGHSRTCGSPERWSVERSPMGPVGGVASNGRGKTQKGQISERHAD
ncbi:hypothetical protein NDU88_002647 [Pleurodeles waltl]|uniref:Uncharacterized protein n=1 Tax=Pleurodeles waltl TaxID=8319 RepID=A0AAV7TMF4_PLEWA|nr:hypothetical protein NDU88_002647 [Pleurodeles waltl]